MAGTTDPSGVLEQVVAQREQLSHRLETITHLVAITSGKGGVGKTTLTANIAAALARRGWRVGVLDADINGPTLALMLGARGQSARIGPEDVEPAVGVGGIQVMSMDLFVGGNDSPVNWHHPDGLAEDTYVWRGAMETTAVREMLADTRWGDLDALLVDLPPGTERFSTFSRLLPQMTGVAVTIPGAASHLVVRRSVAAASDAGGSFAGLVENMTGHACPSCGELGPGLTGRAGGAAFAADIGVPFLGSLPFDPRLAHASDTGRPLAFTHPEAPAALAVATIADRLLQGPPPKDQPSAAAP